MDYFSFIFNVRELTLPVTRYEVPELFTSSYNNDYFANGRSAV
jgi:hypothetical protein